MNLEALGDEELEDWYQREVRPRFERARAAKRTWEASRASAPPDGNPPALREFEAAARDAQDHIGRWYREKERRLGFPPTGRA